MTEIVRDKENNHGIKSVAFVLSKFGRGGAERVVYQLAKSLRNRGIDILCICLEEIGSLGERIQPSDFNFISLNSQSSYDLKSLADLSKYLYKFNPDIVNVHSYSVLPYVSLASLSGTIHRVVFTAHGLLYEGFKKYMIRYRAASYCLAGLSAVSEQVAERHRIYLGWRKPIEVIENGIEIVVTDDEKRGETRKTLGITDDTFVFLNIGNIRPEKGIENIFKAVYILKSLKVKKKFCVVIVGAAQDKPYYEKSYKLSVELGVTDNIVWAGHVNDVNAIYAIGDAFLLSSRSEGLPLVVLEAMSCGLPVIATRVGGVPQVLKNGTGILINPSSPEQMASAMQKIINDEVLRRILREKSLKRFAEDYTIEKMAQKYINYFDELKNG